MTLDQIFRRFRRKQAEPELSPATRAYIDASSRHLEGWTTEQLDELTQSTIDAHEAEFRQAAREMEQRAKHRHAR